MCLSYSYAEGMCANCAKLGICRFAKEGKQFCNNFAKDDDDI